MSEYNKAVVLKRVQKLNDKGSTAQEIADDLNASGLSKPQGGQWTAGNIATFKSKNGMKKLNRESAPVIKEYSGKTASTKPKKQWKTYQAAPLVTVIRGSAAEVADVLRALA